jgi:hypothetical protein
VLFSVFGPMGWHSSAEDAAAPGEGPPASGSDAGADRETSVAAVALSLSTNASAVTAGNTLAVSVRVAPTLESLHVDLFFGALFPDGNTLVFLTDPGFGGAAVGRLSDPSTWHPILAGVDLSSALLLNDTQVFRYTWSGGEPAGVYTLFFAALRAGTLEVLALATARVEFVRPTLQLAGLSSPGGRPGQILILSGTGFDPTGDVSILFSDEASFAVSVPPLFVNQSVVATAIPIFMGPSGQSLPGVVGVQVVETLPGRLLVSNVIPGFQIQDLPTSAHIAGTVTSSLLRGAVAGAQGGHQALTGLGLGGSAVDSALNTQAGNLGALANAVDAVRSNPLGTFSLGTLAGRPLTIGATELARVDRALVAMAAALAQPFPSVASVADFPESVSPSVAEGGCMGAQGAAFAQAAQNPDADLSPLARDVVFASYQQVNCHTAEAATTGFGIVSGTGAVALGILALAGVPAAALALPTAALIYVTIVGGAGIIAVGGALGQSTPGAIQQVQAGVAVIETTLEHFILPRVASLAGETSGAIVHLTQGAWELIHSVSQAPSPSAPPTPPPPSPGAQCCIDTGGCPGETGSQCGAGCCCCGVGQRCCPDVTRGCCAASVSSTPHERSSPKLRSLTQWILGAQWCRPRSLL